MSFAQIAKYLRDESGLSQMELSKKLGISAAAIGFLELGKHEPNGSTIIAYSKYFNVSADQLLEIEEEFNNVVLEKNLFNSTTEKMGNYGKALKEHRLLRGLTLKEIEKETGINNGNLSRWERGEVLPNIDFCVQLANFYGISLDELVGISDILKKNNPVKVAIKKDNPQLSADDEKLLSAYHSLSPELRETLWALINSWQPEPIILSKKK